MWEAWVPLVFERLSLNVSLRYVTNPINIFYLRRNIEYYRFTKKICCVKSICESSGIKSTFKSGRLPIVMNL